LRTFWVFLFLRYTMSMRKKFLIKSTALDKKGNKLAVSFNDYTKSNPWQKALSLKVGLSEHRICLHSEVSCLLKCKAMNKSVHTLIIERYDSVGNPKIAFPCLSCQEAIKLMKVKMVQFTTDDGFQEWLV
jgi:Cytidine and deoxycytidylate deaminase zinc-binding region